ncbi:MAG: MFS transporter [Cyanobacteria bacterium J083]|nr:MAG: MFS transporter [Cyanobacteria bacterium J083]
MKLSAEEQNIEGKDPVEIELTDLTKEPRLDKIEPENICPSQRSQGFLPVLKNKNFLQLWLGQVFSQIADKVYLVLCIALIAANFQIPGQNISRWVSPVTIAFTIPAVLFGSLAGVFVDRWSKKAVLVISNLLRGILVLFIPFAFHLTPDGQIFNFSSDFWILLLITLVVSILTQFFAPAEQAVIPLIVKKQDLLPANSLYTTTMMAVLIMGFAVGEPLLELADMAIKALGSDIGKELVVGGAYILAGIILLNLKTGETSAQRQTHESHPLQDIREGISYLQQNHKVRNALIQLVILFSIFAALVILVVSLADRLPSLDADQFGILLAVGGIGMGIGAAFVGSWGQRFSHIKLSLIGSIGLATTLVGLSVSTQSLTLALSMTLILGFFAALVGVPMQTTIQSETPPDMRGKVFGLQNNAVNIALSLPLVLAAEAEARLGLSNVFLLLAGLALAGGCLTWYISVTDEKISAS